MPDGFDPDEIDLARLADDVGRSPSRAAETLHHGLGIPLDGYASWVRLVTAIESLVDGAGLPTAPAAARLPEVDDLAEAGTSIFGFDPGLTRGRTRPGH